MEGVKTAPNLRFSRKTKYSLSVTVPDAGEHRSNVLSSCSWVYPCIVRRGLSVQWLGERETERERERLVINQMVSPNTRLHPSAEVLTKLFPNINQQQTAQNVKIFLSVKDFQTEKNTVCQYPAVGTSYTV